MSTLHLLLCCIGIHSWWDDSYSYRTCGSCWRRERRIDGPAGEGPVYINCPRVPPV